MTSFDSTNMFWTHQTKMANHTSLLFCRCELCLKHSTCTIRSPILLLIVPLSTWPFVIHPILSVMVTLKVGFYITTYLTVLPSNCLHIDLWDIIYVTPDSFVKNKTRDIAHQIAKLTQKLHEENRRYVLIGPGMTK